MYYVYILKSSQTNQIYIGYTRDLTKRLVAHNTGNSLHTAKYKPWELQVFLGFKNKFNATAFEKYLKSHAGRAFALKRLL